MLEGVVTVLAQGGRMISWGNSKRGIVPRGCSKGVLEGGGWWRVCSRGGVKGMSEVCVACLPPGGTSKWGLEVCLYACSLLVCWYLGAAARWV